MVDFLRASFVGEKQATAASVPDPGCAAFKAV
jgi:hypothetical protein